MRADSLYSFEFDSLFVDAVCLRMAGNDSAALEGFIRCYELNPGSAAVNYEIGSLKLQGGKEHADEGLRYMKRAVDNDPGNYYYLTILARLYTTAWASTANPMPWPTSCCAAWDGAGSCSS